MGWESLVSDLSWPVVVLIVFFVLRNPIALLIPKLRSIKGPGGWGFEFSEKAANAEERSKALAAPRMALQAGESEAPAWVDELHQLADVSPRAAILEAFLRVEEQILRLAKPFGQPRGVTSAARRLADGGIVPRDVLAVLDDLTAMRNQAVHSSEFVIPPTAATSYVDAAANVVSALEGAGRPAKGA
jgi:hypothetical protein